MPAGNVTATVKELLARGRALHKQANPGQAARIYQQVLAIDPANSDATYLLGLVRYRSGQVDEGMRLVAEAVSSDPANRLALGSLAQMHFDRGRYQLALELFGRAIGLKPASAVTWYGYALSNAMLGNLQAALAALQRVIEIQPAHAAAYNSLGNVMRRLGNEQAAEECYQHSVELTPEAAEGWNNLGVVAQHRGRVKEAIGYFEKALTLRSGYAEALSNLGAVLADTGEADRAMLAYQNAIDINPAFTPVYVNAGLALNKAGRNNEAREVLELAARIDPTNFSAQWSRCFCSLDTVYRSEEGIAEARSDYHQRLNEIISTTPLDNPVTREQVASVVGSIQPFQLAYQGHGDLQLQNAYGDFVCAALGLQVDNLPRPADGEPLRIGIVSAFYYQHSNWKAPIQGWARYLSRCCELTAIYTGQKKDAVTDVAKSLFHHFIQGGGEQDLVQQIQQRKLHCLIYPEIGMDQLTMRLAARRLAALQCVSWGHPVTSGFPSMDLYLGSDLMEPDDAQAGYRERLIRLPGLSFSYQPESGDHTRPGSRSAFGLDSAQCVYLCVQNLSKYLPRHDHLLVSIVRDTPGAVLVFINGAEGATDILRQRLGNKLQQAGLDPAQRLLFLPRLDRDQYRMLNSVADIFLDTPGWSGCNSTLEALHTGLPVVTLPGELMRSRHSAACYRMMGITELVAADEQQYVSLAVRLGRDTDFRQAMRQQIIERITALTGDGAAEQVLAGILRDALVTNVAGNQGTTASVNEL